MSKFSQRSRENRWIILRGIEVAREVGTQVGGEAVYMEYRDGHGCLERFGAIWEEWIESNLGMMKRFGAIWK